MKPISRLCSAVCLSFGLMFLVLTGCDQEGPAERAGEAIDEAAENAGEAIEDAGESVQDAAN